MNKKELNTKINEITDMADNLVGGLKRLLDEAKELYKEIEELSADDEDDEEDDE